MMGSVMDHVISGSKVNNLHSVSCMEPALLPSGEAWQHLTISAPVLCAFGLGLCLSWV